MPSASSFEACCAVAQGIWLQQQPLEKLFREMKSDCLITDMFFPWTADLAAELGIPRLVLHTSSYFEHCADHSLRHYMPHKSSDEQDVVLLPGLPYKFELLRSQIPDWVKTTNRFTRIMDSISESELRSYGAVFNSFHELESAYEEHFVKTLGIKAWSIGPVFLWLNQEDAPNKTQRYDFGGGKEEEETQHEIMEWLSSKEENSVLYVGFGSMTRFHGTQLAELAHGLEACSRSFVWVVSNWGDLPQGFKERAEESRKGYLLNGWAPQKMILDHPATGGMVTHCGWNSIMEGLTAGLPMITWPLFAEQFYNEKLVIDFLRVGVPVGVTQWQFHCINRETKQVIKSEQVEMAVAMLMGIGEEAEMMRKRARKIADSAKKAVECGEQSRANLMSLINELKSLKIQSSTANT